MDMPKLTRVHRLDSIRLDETYFTKEGYFIDHPVTTRIGIFEYIEPDGSKRRELRLPEHVFDERSLATYEGKPVIITHEAGRVDKGNVADETVGTILSAGYRDGDDVRCKVIIHSIDEVRMSGLRELSLGYDMVIDETPGTWQGKPYDAIQTEITINHLALVRDARAGEQSRLNLDGKNKFESGGNEMLGNRKKRPESKAQQFVKRFQRRLDEDGAAEEEKEEGLFPQHDEIEEGDSSLKSIEDRVNEILERRDRRDAAGDLESEEDAIALIAEQDEDIEKLVEIVEELTAGIDVGNAEKEDGFEEDPPEGTDEDEGDEYAFSGSDKEEAEDGSDEAAGDDIPVIGGGEEESGGITLTIRADSVDRIIRERIKLGRIGDKLNLDGLEEMNPWDAKKAIIKRVYPSMRLDGKGKPYVRAAFDLALGQVDAIVKKDTDYQRRQMTSRADSADNQHRGKTAAQQSREKMIEKQIKGGKR